MMAKKPIVKVCGMRSAENIRAVENLGADFIGMIFYPKSPRYVSHVPEYLPHKSHLVGVFVNADIDEIDAKRTIYHFDYIQLHGCESIETCRILKSKGYRIIKAFSVKDNSDLDRTKDFNGLCDYFLFDTKTENYGGSGQTFDWELLKNYNGPTPFLLSGGIGMEQLDALKTFRHPQCAGYDLNSRFEKKPGEKDIKLLKNFLEILLTI